MAQNTIAPVVTLTPKFTITVKYGRFLTYDAIKTNGRKPQGQCPGNFMHQTQEWRLLRIRTGSLFTLLSKQLFKPYFN